MPICLISLMRAEGTGPHFEFAAQSKLVCLAPSLIISVFRGRTALITILEGVFTPFVS